VKQHFCHVVENRILWADAQLLAVDAPELARAMRPGQFALARAGTTFDPYLRRALWLYVNAGAGVAFVLSAHDPLAARIRVGDQLDLLAQLGHAIDLGAQARHVLLIGEGTRIVQLIALAHALVTQDREVVLVNRGEDVFPAYWLSPEIEYRTDDAWSTELLAWADVIVTSGSEELYRALADAIRAARYRLEPGFARVFVDVPMPCGTGACYACAVETTRGIQLACADGPAFDLIEFENRRVR
jgi:dihydroorotate dehydrogenase electron transfer subunit